MACGRNALVSSFGEREVSDEIREIFEICKNGDVSKVRRYIMNGLDLNIRDTAGRKSSPLHFAAGKAPSNILKQLYLARCVSFYTIYATLITFRSLYMGVYTIAIIVYFS